MYEAVIQYESGRILRIEAGSLDLLKYKCNPFKEKETVTLIDTYKKEYVGSIKHPLILEKDLLK